MTPVIVCEAPRVIDGDGFACRTPAGRVEVRLVAINAREHWGGCRRGHPCPPATAAAARAHLERLLALGPVACRPVSRSYDRIVARCHVRTIAGPLDLSCAQVRARVAAPWARYGKACPDD